MATTDQAGTRDVAAAQARTGDPLPSWRERSSKQAIQEFVQRVTTEGSPDFVPPPVGFLGWFGPRGLASIVFVLILVEQTQLPERSLMLTVVTWTVALSVYAHGLSAWPGANRYADWYAAHRRDHGSMPESVPTTEQRVRVPALPRQSSGPT
jgi:hypothetical protein